MGVRLIGVGSRLLESADCIDVLRQQIAHRGGLAF